MNPYLLPVLEYGPEIVRRLVMQMEPSRLDEPTSPDRFSSREVIAHLADWEPILLARMHKAIESPGAVIEAYDEGEMAVTHGYSRSNIQEQLASFASHRHATAEFLRGLADEDWDKAVTHPERGLMTLRDQANMLLGHDLYHIEQLTSLIGDKTVSTW
jgi:hypothetical protein